MRINEASVADELAFEALPIETQEMVKRLYGSRQGDYTEQDIMDAYEAGFEDAADQMERPWCNPAAASHYVKAL